ncbi:hypothetical protein T265_07236 [Opisthorchis viverrini]|uniref:Uncharacterized protein n=1 Tax=Opisthorchis viverrini TaxID=6198 RepID=A0A074ZPQ2_OPIVI|nr:hypothetical protein T265_07236 [Opisthorchis viverrini]KER25300.1 hypothetical protein T265_07236 [Opisthorchis viverrini]
MTVMMMMMMDDAVMMLMLVMMMTMMITMLMTMLMMIKLMMTMRMVIMLRMMMLIMLLMIMMTMLMMIGSSGTRPGIRKFNSILVDDVATRKNLGFFMNNLEKSNSQIVMREKRNIGSLIAAHFTRLLHPLHTF